MGTCIPVLWQLLCGSLRVHHVTLLRFITFLGLSMKQFDVNCDRCKTVFPYPKEPVSAPRADRWWWDAKINKALSGRPVRRAEWYLLSSPSLALHCLPACNSTGVSHQHPPPPLSSSHSLNLIHSLSLPFYFDLPSDPCLPTFLVCLGNI